MNRYAGLKQGASTRYQVQFVDEDGTAISEGAILTIVMTLYNEADGAIINSRNAIDVKDANIGTLAPDGTLTLDFTPDDMPIIDTDCEVEYHIVLLKFTYSDGTTKTGIVEAALGVQQITNLA